MTDLPVENTPAPDVEVEPDLDNIEPAEGDWGLDSHDHPESDSEPGVGEPGTYGDDTP